MLIEWSQCCRRASQVALVVKNPPAMQEPQETRVQIRGGEDPLEEGMAAHSSILAHGQRSLVGHSPQGLKELDMNECTHTQYCRNVIVLQINYIIQSQLKSQ